ncbi:MAG: thioredoxin domain-containing protein [Patescibacteria group bacterium]
MPKQSRLIVWIAIITVLAGGALLLVRYQSQPGALDLFAQCLKEKGAIFYEAFWCPHCQNQKAMFGKSAKLLPYVECSTPDGKSQLQICKDKNIEGYPTWEFTDGSRESGEVSLGRLSEKTGCPLP